ncbi:MAG: hypothetical protein WBV94_04405 [Blastocatellia bacterium]
MRIRAVAHALALMLALTVLPVVSAQDSLQDWSVVQAIAPGTELIIETKTAETIKGKLGDITGTTLNLSQGGKSVALEQKTIHRIYLVQSRSALRGAAKGAYIGARISRRRSYSYLDTPKSILLGGAVVGAVIEGRNRKGQLIYETK